MEILVKWRVQAPVETVFETLADFSRYPDFIDAIPQVSLDTQDTIGIGTEITMSRIMIGGTGQETVRISEFAPPADLAYTAEAHGMRYVTSYRVGPADADGTRFMCHFANQPLTFKARILSALMRRMKKDLEKLIEADMRQIVEEAERRHRASQPVPPKPSGASVPTIS